MTRAKWRIFGVKGCNGYAFFRSGRSLRPKLERVQNDQLGESCTRCLYMRKEAKTYGTCNLIERGYRRHEVAVVVEDVVTSGGQVVTSVLQMREAGRRLPGD